MVIRTILTWRRREIAVREALQKLGIDVSPLKEEETLQKYGIFID